MKQEVNIKQLLKIAYNICPNYIKLHSNFEINSCSGTRDICAKDFGQTDRQGNSNIAHNL